MTDESQTAADRYRAARATLAGRVIFAFNDCDQRVIAVGRGIVSGLRQNVSAQRLRPALSLFIEGAAEHRRERLLAGANALRTAFHDYNAEKFSG